MILFTADWHIKLGQKNVPMAWACARYKMFFEQIQEIEKCDRIDLHIIGGDLFDRVPSMDELSLYFDFVKGVSKRTIIFDGNHEATRKNKTFFTNLKKATTSINPLVEVIDETYYEDDWAIKNIIYPGSPMTTSFHRNLVKTGYLLIDNQTHHFDEDWSWTWHQFDLPQLLRKTVVSEDEMVQTDFHHTIYEIEGDVSDLSNIKNSEVISKIVSYLIKKS